jgi:hypothetical protein
MFGPEKVALDRALVAAHDFLPEISSPNIWSRAFETMNAIVQATKCHWKCKETEQVQMV